MTKAYFPGETSNGSNAESFLSGNIRDGAWHQMLSLAGTFSTGDTITVSLTSTLTPLRAVASASINIAATIETLYGGNVATTVAAVTYTVAVGDTLATIADGIAALINGTGLTRHDCGASVSLGQIIITYQALSRITFACSTDSAGGTISVTGPLSSPPSPLYETFTLDGEFSTGDTVSFSATVCDTVVDVTYTVLADDTMGDIAAGLVALIVASGLVASASWGFGIVTYQALCPAVFDVDTDSADGTIELGGPYSYVPDGIAQPIIPPTPPEPDDSYHEITGYQSVWQMILSDDEDYLFISAATSASLGPVRNVVAKVRISDWTVVAEQDFSEASNPVYIFKPSTLDLGVHIYAAGYVGGGGTYSRYSQLDANDLSILNTVTHLWNVNTFGLLPHPTGSKGAAITRDDTRLLFHDRYNAGSGFHDCIFSFDTGTLAVTITTLAYDFIVDDDAYSFAPDPADSAYAWFLTAPVVAGPSPTIHPLLKKVRLADGAVMSTTALSTFIGVDSAANFVGTAAVHDEFVLSNDAIACFVISTDINGPVRAYVVNLTTQVEIAQIMIDDTGTGYQDGFAVDPAIGVSDNYFWYVNQNYDGAVNDSLVRIPIDGSTTIATHTPALSDVDPGSEAYWFAVAPTFHETRVYVGNEGIPNPTSIGDLNAGSVV